MKVCLVAHGYPPELVGGTEKAMQGLARGLARRGHGVLVVAGSMRFEGGFRTTEARDGAIGVVRIHRDDLYFDHWQKSASPRVAAAFREVLRRERPDVVHVHHWIRLSRDLAATAALEGIPAVLTLHDLWTSCLVAFRVRPGTREFCEVPLAPDPCLACAAGAPPRTPWRPRAEQVAALAEHKADLLRELALARAVLVPSAAHGAALQRFLGLAQDTLALTVVPHGRDLALTPRTPLAAPGAGRPLVLGMWGHVHPLKGVDLAIDALRRLPDPRAVALRVAGAEMDVAYAADVRARATGLDVSFHGPFDESELDHHPVTAVHAMLSGSRAHESWGLVVDEALALRLPLVLPRSGAFPERLEEGRGALFYERDDAASLARALARLVGEPGLLDELRATLPPLDIPSSREHVSALEDVYARAVATGAPAPPPDDPARAGRLAAAEAEWDARLAGTSAEELGFA